MPPESQNSGVGAASWRCPFARQQLVKYIAMAMNTHATIGP
jgi:hypothetical protein